MCCIKIYEKNLLNIFLFLILYSPFALCNPFQEVRNLQYIDDAPVSFLVIDGFEESTNKVIQEVLVLQNALIVDNQATTELPRTFKEKGFLTIRMNRDILLEILRSGGKIVTARSQAQLVGYLILCRFNSFKWAQRVDINFKSNVDELERYFLVNCIHEIDQIAVAHSFVKQGIGKQMVEIAKQLSPQGLSTYILSKPFTNQASLSFFSKQNFFHIGTAYEVGESPKFLVHEIYIQLWVPSTHSPQ